jgi:hypothetical protein
VNSFVIKKKLKIKRCPLFQECKKTKLTCAFSCPWIFILIENKFNIEINNDELLIIIWEHSNLRKIVAIVCSNVEPKLVLLLGIFYLFLATKVSTYKCSKGSLFCHFLYNSCHIGFPVFKQATKQPNMSFTNNLWYILRHLPQSVEAGTNRGGKLQPIYYMYMF